MSEETEMTAEQIAAAKEAGAALAAMTLAALTEAVANASLPAIQYAHAIEMGKGVDARKGALTTLESALLAHEKAAGADGREEADAGASSSPQSDQGEPAAAPPVAQSKPELPATHIAMQHPDGGTSDRFETDEDGNLIVPLDDIAEMQSHGFQPVSGS